MDADFSNWWNGGYVNGGDESAVPMLIARPIVEHELRASRTNNRLNNGRVGHFVHDSNCDVVLPLHIPLSEIYNVNGA
jgi:hypothetical protein